jgi:dTDP-glucose 4,6-dehydratase/UDP-glucuronate decarboxylase
MDRPMISLATLLDEDLGRVCTDAAAEFDRMSGGRLLVTGGGGFLGYSLVQAPLHWNRMHPGRAPIEVVVWDNWLRGRPQWLQALEGTPHLSVRDYDLTRALPADIGHFDWIVHAASIASPIYYRAMPIRTIDANVNGLRNLLDYAVARRDAGTPVSGLLFFSSSEIYGDPSADAIPTPETYRGFVSCTGPRACYDEAKRFGETLCVVFAQAEQVPARVARPFNNYGPGLKINDGRVIPDFARDILAGRDIVMLSDGSPTRTFCYASDAITGYFKVLVSGRAGEAYNVGIQEPEISMAALAELMAATARPLLGYTGKVTLGRSQEAAYLVDNPNRRCPVIDKIRGELGFEPRVGIEEGIWRTLAWYHHNPRGAEG